MAIRIFTCPCCGHKMRLSGSTCHSCYQPKPGYQQPKLVLSSAFTLAIGLSLLAVEVL